MNVMKQQTLLLMAVALVFAPRALFAARIMAVPQAAATAIGQELRVDVVVDTGLENINALSGVISVPKEAKVRVEDGQSVIGQWLEQPQFNDSKGSVSFSGIVPNGFKGIGVVFSLYIEITNEGAVTLSAKDLSLYKNDGLATQISLAPNESVYSVVKKLDITLPKPVKDTDPPFNFTPIIARSTDLFDGDYFVMFNALDTNSGIDHYEVLESKNKLSSRDLEKSDRGWRMVKNPTPLEDQKLSSYIYIKAVDRAGNSQLASMLPAGESSQQASFNIYLGFGILVLLVVTGAAWFFSRRRNDRNADMPFKRE
jgi:hypothetical protein